MTIALPKGRARIICQKAIASARAGDKDAARKLLQQAVILDPANEVAWLYLAGLTDNRQEAEQALDRVERVNPANPHLVKARAWVRKTWPEPTVAPGDDTKPIDPLAAAAKMTPTI
nr:tetratricopeptide repeat protein [Phycisphaerae bacterium]